MKANHTKYRQIGAVSSREPRPHVSDAIPTSPVSPPHRRPSRGSTVRRSRNQSPSRRIFHSWVKSSREGAEKLTDARRSGGRNRGGSTYASLRPLWRIQRHRPGGRARLIYRDPTPGGVRLGRERTCLVRRPDGGLPLLDHRRAVAPGCPAPCLDGEVAPSSSGPPLVYQPAS